MSHISEERFRDEVVIPWIREHHPDADLELERWVDRSGAFCDIWVSLSTHSLAIEVGNNDSTVREEAAQAMEYAADSPTAVPVVIVPVGHGEPEVVRIFEERGVMIWMLPTEGTA